MNPPEILKFQKSLTVPEELENEEDDESGKGSFRKTTSISFSNSDTMQAQTSEDRGSGNGDCDIARLREKQFLLSCERGDIGSVRKLLANISGENFNLNTLDPLGRNALLIAIENENIEMIELLLDHNIETGDAILYAIGEENVEAVEIIVEHLEKMDKFDAERQGVEITEHSAFTPDVTPIVLAAHKDNYECIKLFLDKKGSVPHPHDVRCSCQECYVAREEDSLRLSRSRINAYRALTSPSLICLSARDPILYAFELSWELRRLSYIENEFKTDYEELSQKCQKFCVHMLDQVRGSKELEIVLNHTTNAWHDVTSANTANTEQLARLKLAIQLSQKRFVAHPNCQQLLLDIWYDGVENIRNCNYFYKFIFYIFGMMMFPILSLIYFFAPHSPIGRFARKPFIKFLSHTGSYIFFLVLLIMASQRVQVIDQLFNTGEFRKETRGPPPTIIECAILLWVLGLIWVEIKQLWESGLFNYCRNLWNILDFITNSLYLCTFALRVVSYYQVEKESLIHKNARRIARAEWDSFDPTLVAECFFSTANIFSSLKLVHVFTVMGLQLGKLEISEDVEEKGWFDIPYKLRSTIIDLMDTKSKCRFAICSKKCAEEVEMSGIDIESIKVFKYRRNSLAIKIISKDVEKVLEFTDSSADHSSTLFHLFFLFFTYLLHIFYRLFDLLLNPFLHSPSSSAHLANCRPKKVRVICSDINFNRNFWEKKEIGEVDDVILKYYDYFIKIGSKSLKELKIEDGVSFDGKRNIKQLQNLEILELKKRVDFRFCDFQQLCKIEKRVYLEIPKLSIDQVFQMEAEEIELKSVKWTFPEVNTFLKRCIDGELNRNIQYLRLNFNWSLDSEIFENLNNVSVYPYGESDEYEEYKFQYKNQPNSYLTVCRMVIDIVKFFMVYALVLFSFSCGLNQLLWYYASLRAEECLKFKSNNEDHKNLEESCADHYKSCASLYHTAETLFWALFGLIDLTHFRLKEPHILSEWTGKTIFGSYCCCSIIVLLNMLIAMMSNSYQYISSQADIEWKFARSRLFLEYFDDSATLPPPFNIIPSPKSIYYCFRYLSDRFCPCSEFIQHGKQKSLRNQKILRVVNDRENNYRFVTRNLVQRYIAQMQRVKQQSEGVSEDDVNEIKQDISAFRYELLGILRTAGFQTGHTDINQKTYSRNKKRAAMAERRLKSAGLVDLPVPQMFKPGGARNMSISSNHSNGKPKTFTLNTPKLSWQNLKKRVNSRRRMSKSKSIDVTHLDVASLPTCSSIRRAPLQKQTNASFDITSVDNDTDELL
ncbi:unnamed protein product [Caenorhabditis angaria]|uniref:Transient receptor ion channel domain-containing protein n=1 Tax=Caenorhabditis angaria TaxID=860376 RepID=A0A9P1IFU0_9PELO|nr:unnamed protein product [Caenorhabditis angaria]